MLLNQQRRTWAKVVTILFVLLPGFPVLLQACAITTRVLGVSHVGFLPMLITHQLYYKVPEMMFGEPLYPIEEFGVIPTPAGYAIAAVVYAFIALGLSFPICWLILRGKVQSCEATPKPLA